EAVLVQVRAGDIVRPVQEGVAVIARSGGIEDLLRPANDPFPSHWMELLEPLRHHRDVARSDLEKTVTAERAAPPALELLRLFGRHAGEELVGARQNPFV